jgi:hypothetical protein
MFSTFASVAVAHLCLVWSMRTINIGQFYGELVDALFWLIAGTWTLFGWPRSIGHKIARQELTTREGQARLRTFPPQLGYVFILMAIAQVIMELDQLGFFEGGRAIFGSLVLFAMSFALVVFWWRQTHKNEI